MKHELTRYFSLLADKQKNVENLKEITKTFNTTIESLYSHLQEQIKSIENHIASKSFLNTGKASILSYLIQQFETTISYFRTRSSFHANEVDKKSEEDKQIKHEILQHFIEIILDDLNTFFILKIYAKSFNDNFILYLRDKLHHFIAESQSLFVEFVAGYDPKKIQQTKMDDKKSEINNINPVCGINPEKNKKFESSVILQDFLNNQFGEDSNFIIVSMNKMLDNHLEELLKIEELIIKWYFAVLDENEIEKNIINKTDSEKMDLDENTSYKNENSKIILQKNELQKLFIKEYFKRQRKIKEKFVKKFKLDKTKYLNEKDDLLPFEKLGFMIKDLLDIVHETNHENNETEVVSK